jgi:hypothetical protein
MLWFGPPVVRNEEQEAKTAPTCSSHRDRYFNTALDVEVPRKIEQLSMKGPKELHANDELGKSPTEDELRKHQS